MSILIKGMEMPRPKLAGMVAVYNAYIVVRHNGDAKIVVDNEDKTDSTDYPLVPVLPHGRLGDLDELAKKIEHDRYNHTHTDGLAARHHIAEYGHFLKEIATAPTIIPAEPAEEGE